MLHSAGWNRPVNTRSCPVPMRVFGHRGAAGHCPENTLASLRHAIALGVDAVEIGVFSDFPDRVLAARRDGPARS